MYRRFVKKRPDKPVTHRETQISSFESQRAVADDSLGQRACDLLQRTRLPTQRTTSAVKVPMSKRELCADGTGLTESQQETQFLDVCTCLTSSSSLQTLSVATVSLSTTLVLHLCRSLAQSECGLQAVSLVWCGLTDLHFALFASVAKEAAWRSSLTAIDLSGNQLTSACVPELKKLIQDSAVLHVSLAHNELSDGDQQSICDLVQDPHLRSIDLGFCSLRPDQALGILNAAGLGSVVFLGLDNAPVPFDIVAEQCEALWSNTTLQKVSLDHCTAAGAKAFRSRISALERRNVTVAAARGMQVLSEASPFIVEGDERTSILSSSEHDCDNPTSFGAALPQGYHAYSTNHPGLQSNVSR
jgi:hypothetical protein